MATKRSQRIGIWIIAGALIIGTLAGFLAMIIAPKNAETDQARLEKLSEEYGNEYSEYQAKISANLAGKYYDTLKQYESRVGEFDAASVTELQKEDLVQGEGDELTDEDSFTAYYIGWNPSGKIFDSSFQGETLKAPLDVAPGSVISGWTEGVVGMKPGGVRELTIPPEKAYGDKAQGEDIPANTPLKFIVLIVSPADKEAAEKEIGPAPEMPKELKDYYRKTYGLDL